MAIYTVEGPHPEGWASEAAASFVTRMVEGFPCVFGVDAVHKGTLRFAFVPLEQRERELAKALIEFARCAHEVGKRPSLVAFFEDDPTLISLDQYRRAFWDLLQTLHEADVHEWPKEIPTSPDHPHWEFSYAGMPFFVVASTPAHQDRRSRYSDHFTIAFQPRFGFDTLGPKQDKNARRVIRGRLHEYDAIPPSPELGVYGETPEWRQYFLPDDNEPQLGSCPFH